MKRSQPLQRYTRLQSASRKYSQKLRCYSVRRRAFLAIHSNCELGPVLHAADIQTDCWHRSSQIHHMRRRGKYLLDESTWRASCGGECHRWVETHANQARDLGLLK